MAHNIWDNIENADDVPKEIRNLSDIIDLSDLTYGTEYREQEDVLLTPQLEALGYKHVQFLHGEADCWGPLTRLCRTLDRDNKIVWFIYG